MPPRGRPPVQHIKHVHVLSLSPELEEKIGDLQDTFIKGKTIRATGGAVRGLLSNPAGIGLVIVIGVWLIGRLGLWRYLTPDAVAAVESIKGFFADVNAGTLSGVEDIAIVTMGAFTKFMGRLLGAIKIPV